MSDRKTSLGEVIAKSGGIALCCLMGMITVVSLWYGGLATLLTDHCGPASERFICSDVGLVVTIFGVPAINSLVTVGCFIPTVRSLHRNERPGYGLLVLGLVIQIAASAIWFNATWS